MANVIRTGVSVDLPCPPAPDDEWNWLAVAVQGEWRFLRCTKKQAGK